MKQDTEWIKDGVKHKPVKGKDSMKKIQLQGDCMNGMNQNPVKRKDGKKKNPKERMAWNLTQCEGKTTWNKT